MNLIQVLLTTSGSVSSEFSGKSKKAEITIPGIKKNNKRNKDIIHSRHLLP